ncbi:hypothetical protein TWF281_004247 [Arthrobotrys megalospora]
MGLRVINAGGHKRLDGIEEGFKELLPRWGTPVSFVSSLMDKTENTKKRPQAAGAHSFTAPMTVLATAFCAAMAAG